MFRIFTNSVRKIIYITVQIFLDTLFPQKASDRTLLSLNKEQAYVQLPPAPKPPFDFIKSIFAYKNDLVTSLIWNIKYKKSSKAVEIGGYALYRKIRELFDTNFEVKNSNTSKNIVDKSTIVLIPIPISQKRRNERGYNQCELLVDEVIKLDTHKTILFSHNLLCRKIHKDRQTLKNRSERLEDAKRIFEINTIELEKLRATISQYSRPIKIIIIDDVVTTGSTMREAVETVRSAGFEDVVGLSIAH